MNNSTVISFVNINKQPIEVLHNIDELINKIENCKKNGYALRNIDLSKIELINIDMGGLIIENVIFNSYNANQTAPKLIQNVNFKGSIIRNASFAHCKLIRCNFDHYSTTIKEINKLQLTLPKSNTSTNNIDINKVDFFLCDFILCRFRRTRINIADFRYSKFSDCSLGGCIIHYGDFYMAAFCGTTNFDNSEFFNCSITYATFENHCLRINSIKGLVQEHYNEYSKIIIGLPNWHKQNPCADFSHLNESEDKNKKTLSKAFIRKEASAVYAQLSGLYAGKGLFKDSNHAYRKAKINEALFNYYTLTNEFNKILNHITFKAKLNPKDNNVRLSVIINCLYHLIGFSISWILGFGYKLNNVIICFICLIVGYTLLFHYCNDNIQPWYNELAYSINNSIGPFEKFTKVVGDFSSSIQTTIGILLIGFVGFVLANRIRNNY